MIFATEFNFTTPVYNTRTEKTELIYDSVKCVMPNSTYKINHRVIAEDVPEK